MIDLFDYGMWLNQLLSDVNIRLSYIPNFRQIISDTFFTVMEYSFKKL